MSSRSVLVEPCLSPWLTDNSKSVAEPDDGDQKTEHQGRQDEVISGIAVHITPIGSSIVAFDLHHDSPRFVVKAADGCWNPPAAPQNGPGFSPTSRLLCGLQGVRQNNWSPTGLRLAWACGTPRSDWLPRAAF